MNIYSSEQNHVIFMFWAPVFPPIWDVILAVFCVYIMVELEFCLKRSHRDADLVIKSIVIDDNE